MAIAKELWDKARALYELGNSLSLISDNTGIDKSSISKKAKSQGWIQGRVTYSDNIENSGIVYIIQAGDSDYCKIGITKGSISERLKQLQTGNHLPLKVKHLYFSSNCTITELELHNRFKKYNTIGEWFKFPSEILKCLILELSNG